MEVALGSTFSRPMVQTVRSAAALGNSVLMRCASSYNAVDASRRVFIMVVPAWFCWPWNANLMPRRPTMPVTTPMRFAGVFQRRPLLDVRFDEAGVTLAREPQRAARRRGPPA